MLRSNIYTTTGNFCVWIFVSYSVCMCICQSQEKKNKQTQEPSQKHFAANDKPPISALLMTNSSQEPNVEPETWNTSRRDTEVVTALNTDLRTRKGPNKSHSPQKDPSELSENIKPTALALKAL